LVLLGHALPPGSHRQGGQDDSAPRAECADLLHAPDHERRCRRVELQDPDDQEDGLRIPKPGTLQDRHLLPLWGTTALPGYPLNTRKNRFLRPSPSSNRTCGFPHPAHRHESPRQGSRTELTSQALTGSAARIAADRPVVWTLTLQSESEGPPFLSCAARLLRVDRSYISASSPRRRGAQSSASRTRRAPTRRAAPTAPSKARSNR